MQGKIFFLFAAFILNLQEGESFHLEGQPGQSPTQNSRYRRATHAHSPKAVYWRFLRFEMGDVLECEISPIASHILLATSSSDVAHVTDVTSSSVGKGYLREQSWESYHREKGSDQEYCQIRDEAFEPYEAVKRARADISIFRDQRVYYNVVTCNCEHWVSKWAMGQAYSGQSSLRPDFWCEVNKYGSELASRGAKAQAYANNFGVKSSASAHMLQARNEGRFWEYEVNGLKAGASASVHGGEGVGGMGRATLVEAGGKIGKGLVSIGGKVGLSADTGIKLGPNTEVKVLGTGFSVGLKKGVELCLFGSCLSVG